MGSPYHLATTKLGHLWKFRNR